MSSSTEDEHLVIWRLFLETHGALLCRLEKELESECNLPLTWYEMLMRLSEAPGHRMRMQELVGTLMLTKSGISRLADRMEEFGMIRRESCPSDRRGSFAVLTPKGADALARAIPVHRRGIREHFGQHLTRDDIAALTSVLTKLGPASAVQAATWYVPRECVD